MCPEYIFTLTILLIGEEKVFLSRNVKYEMLWLWIAPKDKFVFYSTLFDFL